MKSPPSKRVLRLFAVVPFLLLIAVYVVLTVMEGQSRDVFLVNGTWRPYSVSINNSGYELPAHATRIIQLAEGDWTIDMSDTPIRQAQQTVKFTTPFFSRLFMHPTVVLNPDRSAIFVKQEIHYSENQRKQSDSDYEYAYGNLLHQFWDIDYPFTLPEKELKTQRKQIRKNRLMLSQPQSTNSMNSLISHVIEPDDLPDYLMQRLPFEPKNKALLYQLYGTLRPSDPGRFRNWIRHGLPHRPRLFEWHRLYQDISEVIDPTINLLPEYELSREATPIDVYLRARIIRDQSESDRLNLQSETMSKSHGYGYHAIAFQRLCAARFSESLEFAEKAIAVAPKNPSFVSTHRLTRLALKQYAPLLAELESQIKTKMPSPPALALKIQYLHLLNRQNETADLISTFIKQLKPHVAPETLDKHKQFFDAIITYAAGNVASYIRLIGGSGLPADLFQAALLNGRLTAAARFLKDSKSRSYSAYLLVYCAAATSSTPAVAKDMKTLAIGVLKRSGYEEYRVARMLAKEEPADPEILGDLHILPEEKRVLATALGIAFPKHQDAFFAVARRHNFNHNFPQRFLNRIVKPKHEEN